MNALADALQYADPMYNRQELLDSLHDLKEKQIPKLDYALREIEQEIPKASHDPSTAPLVD